MEESNKNIETVYDSYIIDLIRTRALQVHNVWLCEKEIPGSLVEKLRSYAKLKVKISINNQK